MSTTQKDRVLADLDFASDRLSTQVRQISLGALALVWALLVGKEDLGIPVDAVWLIRIALLSIISMALDFGQYVAGYRASRRSWENLRAGGEGKFDRRWLSWRFRTWCFGAKLLLCGINVLVIILVLGEAVVAFP